MAIEISSAKIDITPTPTNNSYLAGYAGDSPRQATGRYSTLWARCIVFWDNGAPNAIAVADVLGFPRSMHQSIRQRIATLAPWAAGDFIVAATHTHNGPVLVEELHPYISYRLTDLSLVEAFSADLENRMVEVVAAALAAPRVPCTLDYQVTTQSFAVNREGLPYKETAVPVLVARRSDGTPAAVVFSYGCHAVSAGGQSRWDGDYPSTACAVVEAAIPNCAALFLIGAAGDQNPSGTFGFPLRTRLGAALGSAVVSAAVSPGRTVTGPILTAYQDAVLPLDVTDTPTNLAAVRSAYQSRRANTGLVGYVRRHAEVMIQRIDSHSFAVAIPVPVHVWKLQGDPLLRIALTGGELASGYAVYFRARYGGANGLLIGSVAGEVPNYIPSNELLPPLRTGGSYAGGWSTDFPGIAGGSMTVYGEIGHYKAGAGGAEERLINVLTGMLT